jgi:hypothetical protein
VANTDDMLERLKSIDQNMAIIKSMLAKVVNYMVEAESEVSEKMRRFIMYMHDVHDVSYMYEERGLSVPPHILREMERCDDRYRQLLDEAHSDGNTFERVRREMAKDENNRWDHSRLIGKGGHIETRESE